VTPLRKSTELLNRWRPHARLHSHLLLLVGAAIALAIFLVSFSITQFAALQADNNRGEMLGAARATAEVVDQRLRGAIAELQELAAIRSANVRSLEALYRDCLAASGSIGAAISYSLPSGEAVFDTRQPFGAQLVNVDHEDEFDEAVETQGPVVSSLVFGSADRRPQFLVHLPIVEHGEVQAVLTATFPAAGLADLLEGQRLPPGWVAGISDRLRAVIARNRAGAALPGTLQPTDLPSVGSSGREDFGAAVDESGDPVYLASVRSAVSGWSAVVRVPQAIAGEAFRAALGRVLGAGALGLALVVGLTVLVVRGLSRSMAALSEAARDLAAAKPVPAVKSTVKEIDEIARALAVTDERLRAGEAGLVRAEDRLAQAHSAAVMGTCRRDYVTNETTWSEQTYVNFGQRPRTFGPSREKILACVHEDDRSLAREFEANIRGGGGQSSADIRIVRPDGKDCVVRFACEPVRNAEGVVTGCFGTLRDVTEQAQLEHRCRELERQLHRAQKLEAVGGLAGGIAHDVNNALIPVLSLARRVRDRIPDGDGSRAYLDIVLDAVARARDLAGRILALSREETETWAEVDLESVLRETLKILRPTISASIDIEFGVGRSVWIWGDAVRLEQAVIDLMVNAAQSIGDKPGRIVVALNTRNAAADGRDIVVLSIDDTGCGMDEAACRRIFEPQLMTKPQGDPTGTDLSKVGEIVASHAGTIRVSSSPGVGTHYEIALPVLRKPDAIALTLVPVETSPD
jgi:signal transduction histidine kinase